MIGNATMPVLNFVGKSKDETSKNRGGGHGTHNIWTQRSARPSTTLVICAPSFSSRGKTRSLPLHLRRNGFRTMDCRSQPFPWTPQPAGIWMQRTGICPTRNSSCVGTEAGGVINAGGLPVGSFSFDYETEYCGAVGQQFVFVYVTTTDGDSFFEECANFPATGASDTFIHEVFTNSQFDFAAKSKFDTIEIGIFNGTGAVAGHAFVKNIVVDGIVVSPDFHSGIDFCAEILK
jgi:hypothetical protein